MKFLAVLASLVTAAAAQSVNIVSPAAGAALTRGSSTTVTLQRPSGTTGVQDVSVVISLASCSGTTCSGSASAIGSVVYAGPYAPAGSPPTQSFNVTVPTTLPAGNVELLVTHFYLSGTGPAVTTDIFGEVFRLR